LKKGGKILRGVGYEKTAKPGASDGMELSHESTWNVPWAQQHLDAGAHGSPGGAKTGLTGEKKRKKNDLLIIRPSRRGFVPKTNSQKLIVTKIEAGLKKQKKREKGICCKRNNGSGHPRWPGGG